MRARLFTRRLSTWRLSLYLEAFSLELLSLLPVIFIGITGLDCSCKWVSNATSACWASRVSWLLCTRSFSSRRMVERAFATFPLPMTKPAITPTRTASVTTIGLMIGSKVTDIVLTKFKFQDKEDRYFKRE